MVSIINHDVNPSATTPRNASLPPTAPLTRKRQRKQAEPGHPLQLLLQPEELGAAENWREGTRGKGSEARLQLRGRCVHLQLFRRLGCCC